MSGSKYNCYDYSTLVLGSLGYALGYTYRVSLAPITDALQNDLNTTSTGIGLLTSSFYITYTLMQLPSGLLLEIYNPSLVLVICWFGLGLSIIAFGFPFNFTFLITIRIISGIFVGPLFLAPASNAQIRFGNKHLAFTMAIIVGIGFFSVLIGGIIQAFLFDAYNNWTHFFFGLGGLCIFSSLNLCICRISEFKSYGPPTIENSIQLSSTSEKDIIDDREKLLKGSSAKAQTSDYFLYKSSSNIWTDEKSKTKHLRYALKKVIRNYSNWIVAIHAFCIGGIYLGLNGLWFIPYLMVKFDYSRQFATVINGLFFVSSAIGGIVIGKICSIYPNKRKLIVIVCTFLGSSSLFIIYFANKSTHYLVIILLNCVTGFVSLFNVTFSLLREYNSKICGDAATGFATTISNLSGVIMPFLIGELMDINWRSRGGNDFNPITNERHYNVDDYNFGFLVLPICFIIQLIASFILTSPPDVF